jgi:RimJ/RimL family protein N-acetyltransferase
MVTIKRVNPENKDFQKLVFLLDNCLDESDKTAHCICEPFNRIDAIKYAVVAYLAGEAVGCGAIREYSPDTMEIKRMFVRENQRRKGVASTILDELEHWAKELNFTRCILETGEKLPEAIKLYQKKGYVRMPNYGPYECLGSSVCFEKNIDMKLITGRTILIPINLEIMNALSEGVPKQLSGYEYNEEWPEDDLKEAFPVFEELVKKNGKDGFNLWLVIEKESNLIIGSAGYIGRPDNEGNVETGFGIIPGRRRKGFCYESVKALLKWGLSHNDVNGIIARCDKSNIASRKTILKLGFKYLAEEDGLLVWKLAKKHET